MTAVFLPATGAELIHADEAGAGVSASILATTELPNEISSIVWSSDPALPAQAVVTTAIAPDKLTATLTVDIPNFLGMIPVLGIDYLLDGAVGTVTDWGAVPDAATQIISYRKQASQPLEYSLTVTVEDTLGSASAVYLIVVDPNYTGGRDSLIAAVAARS